MLWTIAGRAHHSLGRWARELVHPGGASSTPSSSSPSSRSWSDHPRTQERHLIERGPRRRLENATRDRDRSYVPLASLLTGVIDRPSRRRRTRRATT